MKKENKKDEKMQEIVPDKPLSDPTEDELGFKSFAEHIAKSIVKVKGVEGFVIALNGRWGSGKTTLTNFIESYINRFPKSERPIIMKFNPWWFSGQENLMIAFFNQLQVSFEKEKVQGEKLMKTLKSFASKIIDVVPETPYTPKWARSILKNFFNDKASKDITAIKEDIANDLRKQKRKILVVIDDIDRLTAEEIRQIFRLIKAVADFPNIIYLLAFDKRVAVKSLETIQSSSGTEYLEKIIQAEFEVPKPDRFSLNELFFRKLNIVMRDIPQKEFDEQRWQDIYFGNLEKYINTPRNVSRFFNDLTLSYPAVDGEVNPVDFIAIEGLRLFLPNVYEMISGNQKYFAGYASSSTISVDPDLDELKRFHKAWTDKLPEEERKVCIPILMVLFPKLKGVFRNSSPNLQEADKWRIEKRICSSDIFPIYFGMSVSSNSISSLEMKTIVELSANKIDFEKKLLELSKQKLSTGQSRLTLVLDRLRDYGFSNIPKENVPNIVSAFFDIGDKLLIPGDEKLEMFALDNSERIGRILWVLLDRKTKEENFKIIKNAVENGSALAIMTREIRVFSQQHGRNEGKIESEEQRFLTETQLNELEKLLVEKYRKAAKEHTLLDTPRLHAILPLWLKWTDNKDEVKEWVSEVIKNDKDLIRFITQFLARGRSTSSDGVKFYYRLDPKWLEEYIDVASITSRLEEKRKSKNLSSDEKIAIETFFKEKKIRDKGKDPNNPFANEDEDFE